jgi:hypothetical protein
MAHHYLYLCLFSVLFIPSIIAQDYLKLSTPQERDQTDRTYSLVHFDSSRYAVLRFDRQYKYAETEVYNPQLKLVNKFITTDKRRRYGGMINIQGKMYMLFSRYKENNIKKLYEDVSLYAIPVSSDSFKLAKDSTALIEPFDMESNLYRGNFVLSPDQTKLLVYDYEEEGDIEEVRGLTNTINLRVFDTDFNLLWKRKVQLAPTPSGKRLIAIKKLRVSNDGEVAILTDFFRDKRSYSLKMVTADPTLFFVGKDPKHFLRFKPDLGDRFYNEIDFMFDQKGNIYWFGFYSNRKYYQQAGSFFIKINADRSRILEKKIQPFSADLLKALLGRKRLPRKHPEARSFKLVQFRLANNGDLVISAEHQPYGVSNFKSHDLLVMRLDPSGEIRWAKHIFKYNSFPDRYKAFLSHYMQLHQDKIYLLFNRGIYKDSGKAVIIELDDKGNTREKEVFTYRQQTELICPTLSYPLPNGRIFINLQSRFFKYYSFGILDLPLLFKE